MKTIWDLWWGGNKAEKITAYRKVSPGLDLPEDNKQCYSKAKYVLVKMHNRDATDVAKMTPAERDHVFEEAFVAMLKVLEPEAEIDALDRRRFGGLSYTTVRDALALYYKTHSN